MDRVKVGIYSGSFNPIHVAHVALCDWLISEGVVDQVWLIRTPHNPLKAASGLMPDDIRQEMLNLAIEGHEGLRSCTIEDTLPQPNYTINTLRALERQYPDYEFHLIIGADNWLIFDKWRDYDVILRDFHLIVYPRPGYELPAQEEANLRVRFVNAPVYDISSTEIREALIKNDNETVRKMLDPKVHTFLLHIYKHYEDN